jgi:hypothetical protein
MSTPAVVGFQRSRTHSYWCPDCATSTPLTVAPAGDHGFYLGYICSRCLCALDILGILATRELAQALLLLLDPSQQPVTDHAQLDR